MRLIDHAAATCVLLLLAAPAVAQDSALKPLDAAGIRDLLVGNTVSGASTRSTTTFSEYYSPDGRVFGDGGSGPVSDGCWSIRAEGMCFAYGRGRERKTSCWRPHSDGRQVVFMNKNDEVDWIATIEKGNPRDHRPPRSWTCDGTTARLDMMSPRTRIE